MRYLTCLFILLTACARTTRPPSPHVAEGMRYEQVVTLLGEPLAPVTSQYTPARQAAYGVRVPEQALRTWVIDGEQVIVRFENPDDRGMRAVEIFHTGLRVTADGRRVGGAERLSPRD